MLKKVQKTNINNGMNMRRTVVQIVPGAPRTAQKS